MNLKNEKGIIGIDISAAVVITTIFVSILATLLYNINITTNKIKQRSEALEYAITTIEEIKGQGIEAKEGGGSQGYIDETRYYKEISFEDYNPNADTNVVVCKATVIISFGSGKNKETITLSTILT